MQVDTQRCLELLEETNNICFFDLEATGLRGDYNSILCGTIKGYRSDPVTFSVLQVGNDKKVVREIKEELEKYDCWVGFYSKGFDVPMIETRLFKWKQPQLDRKHHLDLYYQTKAKLLTSRRSQAHYLKWLGTPEQKMDVGADVWAGMADNFKENMKVMVERCESDVVGLQNLYDRVKVLIKDITR